MVLIHNKITKKLSPLIEHPTVIQNDKDSLRGKIEININSQIDNMSFSERHKFYRISYILNPYRFKIVEIQRIDFDDKSRLRWFL